MTVEGKIVIKLAEFEEGFFIRNKTLILLKENGVLLVCEIKKDLTSKEIGLLKRDLESGLIKIQDKIRIGAPIAILNEMVQANVYYDDLLIMKAEDKTITCLIVG